MEDELAEEDQTTAVEVHHAVADEGAHCVHIEGVEQLEMIVVVAADHTVAAGVDKLAERSWDGSFGPTMELVVVGVALVAAEGVAAAEGRGEVGHVVAHADHSATEDQDLHIHRGLADLGDQELAGLYMDQDFVDHLDLGIHLADLEVGEGLVLGVDLACTLHLAAEGCKEHGNHRDRLDCHLCRLEEHRRRVEVVDIGAEVAHIRIEDVAVGGLMEVGLVEEGGEEESCIAVRQPSVECCPVAGRTSSDVGCLC